MLPIALRPDGRLAVIVGGGTVALRKAETLAAAGFSLVVVAPAIDDALRALLERTGGVARERPYERGDLAGALAAIAATGVDDVDAAVVEEARAERVLVCDATTGERGDFTMPATLRVGDLTFSVDSGGGAPAFSKRIVRELETAFGHEYALATRTLALMRTYVKAAVPDAERAPVLRELADLPVAMLARLNPIEAEHEVEAAVERLRSHAGEPTHTSSAVCASRTSALALAQTRSIAARLAERGIATTILDVTTAGDRDREKPIAELGTSNVFVAELEQALRDGRADYAVHSCKDLPSELASDMRIAAISPRGDARDAFCSERYASFEELPAGAVVGTSSPRRVGQLRALRPDLRYEPIRGNVDTRLRKLRDGEFDAIVLAMAGMRRLKMRATHTVAFDVERVVPAAGQGALAIEVYAGETDLGEELRAAINDDVTERCVRCERAALRELRMGCNAPIGIHATFNGGIMTVEACYSSGGATMRARLERHARTIDDAEALGKQLGRELVQTIASPASGRVVLPRTQARASRIAEALRAHGIEVAEIREGEDGPELSAFVPDLLMFASSGSVAAAQAYLEHLAEAALRPAVIAMGPQSAQAAAAAGFPADAVAPEASVEAFVALAKERLERR
ncbi:MAG TPA: hydroxymethylbilane synthase [Verrucomicrobiae bacterium]|nr:hydroxymethylbilane synthase [Verrucomicrobiae bacterium]